jgi:hypothetical protein
VLFSKASSSTRSDSLSSTILNKRRGPFPIL